ncbi:Wzz/FepE/Etk N-terminal domain-containing protein [SAR86 cluster bacterium]|nr:Wzz/FepE/Etk N-terminal domain-containing protein [SAR86 cluster bacterium]
MESKNIDLFSDEVKILDLWDIIYSSRKLISYMTLFFSLSSIVYSLVLPPIWRVNLLMISPDKVDSGSLSSGIEPLGALASLSGISIPTSSNKVQTSLAILKSRIFLETFIKNNNIMQILYSDDWDQEKQVWKEEPNILAALTSFRSFIDYKFDLDSGVINFSIDYVDPYVAKEWANKLIGSLNDYLRDEEIKYSENSIIYLEDQARNSEIDSLKLMINSLILEEIKKITIAKASNDFAFKVLDPAVVPLEKIGPQKRVIVILGTLMGLIFSILFVFGAKFYGNLKFINTSRKTT